MSIHPIETRYRGYRFRSRLEARWAVFLDAAKIRWLYEPQGFVVNGRPYLPDFYLQDFGCYFEVKPTSEYDMDFLQSFAYEVGKDVVVAVGGIPDPAEWSCESNIQLRLLHSSRPEEWPDGYIDDMAWGYNDMFLECTSCGRIRIMNEMYSTMKDSCGACADKHARWMPLSYALEAARWMPLSYALEAARGARFEHGECG